MKHEMLYLRNYNLPSHILFQNKNTCNISTNMLSRVATRRVLLHQCARMHRP